MKEKQQVVIMHKPSGEVIAIGPIGWGIFPFEGNYYISKKYLKPMASALVVCLVCVPINLSISGTTLRPEMVRNQHF